MKREHVWLIVGYLVGSFFGVGQLLGLFGGVTGRGAAANSQ